MKVICDFSNLGNLDNFSKVARDAKTNPFSPGAGTSPPELAGRSAVIAEADVALGRAKNGLPTKSQLLLGLRGVGKTVLLNRIAEIAEVDGYICVMIEAPEERRLAQMIVPPLRSTLIRLSAKAGVVAKEALNVLRGFAAAFKVKVSDFEVGLSIPGTADSGDLESDLSDLFLALGRAAKAEGTTVALLVDEVQYLQQEDLSALIVAIHRVNQKALPVVVFGAGLPQLAGLAGDAKSYAERLFSFPDIGSLPDEAARAAITEPLRRHQVEIAPAALEILLENAKGYPYFLQEWASQAWNMASASPITAQDCRLATKAAQESLDANFFRVRFDRLTPMESEYLRAMASLGSGPYRSGDIADVLKKAVSEVAPRRNGLIKKGMLYSQRHGDTAFTVPLFDEFMRRTMPDWAPPASSPKTKRRARPRPSK